MALRVFRKEEREEYAFRFKDIEFGMTVIHPSGNNCQAVEIKKKIRREEEEMSGLIKDVDWERFAPI